MASRSLAAVGLPLLVSLFLTEVNCDCNSEQPGPVGSLKCIQSSLYNNQSQYATCHTNSYIIQKSKGLHSCLNNAPDCFYQCMLDVYDKESGTVYPDCQCNSNISLPVATLPSACYSPSGTNCSWYLTCFEKKLKCSGGLDSYVLAFYEKLCTLAEDNTVDLTTDGLSWVKATRKCLQVELAPLLFPFETFTCSNVSTNAYQKQSVCYREPYQNVPGLCSLSFADFWKIFWATKSALGLKFVESLLGLIRTKSSCTGGLRLDTSMYVMNIRLRLPYPFRRKRDVPSVFKAINTYETAEESSVVMATRRKRHSRHLLEMSSRGRRAVTVGTWQGETSTLRPYHELANEAAVSMSRLLGWDDQQVIWFAYGKETTQNTVLNMSLLLADRHAYNLQVNKWSPSVNMFDAITKAGDTLSSSEANIVINSQKVVMESFLACSDINCKQVVTTRMGPTNGAIRCLEWQKLSILVAAELLILFSTFT